MATRLTKAELLAKIDVLERECAAHIARQDEMQRELDSLYVAQRPSRSAQYPIVYLRGVPHYKIREAHTRVITYRPVAAVQ